MSGSYRGGGRGCERGGWGGRSLVRRDLIVGVLKILFKEPDLILHCGDQAFHFGICLLLEDFFDPPSRGNHFTSAARGHSRASKNASIA